MGETQPAQVYLIGGVPRTGKTTLAKRLARTLEGELIRTDTLRIMFGGDPMSAIRYGLSPSVKPAARAFRPYLSALASSPNAEPLIVEGELIRPKAVAELSKIRRISACFLGLDNADAAFARIIEKHTATDWTYHLEEAQLVAILHKYAHRSAHMKEACEELGIPYFDA